LNFLKKNRDQVANFENINGQFEFLKISEVNFQFLKIYRSQFAILEIYKSNLTFVLYRRNF